MKSGALSGPWHGSVASGSYFLYAWREARRNTVAVEDHPRDREWSVAYDRLHEAEREYVEARFLYLPRSELEARRRARDQAQATYNAMRRFTRLTNGFSKKLENHLHTLSLYFVHYNFVRMHESLRMTPAMAAGLTDTLHDMEWLAELVDAAAPKPGPRGPYKKRDAA